MSGKNRKSEKIIGVPPLSKERLCELTDFDKPIDVVNDPTIRDDLARARDLAHFTRLRVYRHRRGGRDFSRCWQRALLERKAVQQAYEVEEEKKTD